MLNWTLAVYTTTICLHEVYMSCTL